VEPVRHQIRESSRTKNQKTPSLHLAKVH